MCFPADECNYCNIASIERLIYDTQHLNTEQLQSASPIYLLQAIIESFVDGILILTTQCEIVHANEYARQTCRQLMRGGAKINKVPEEIWRICQYLIESRDLFPKEQIFIDSEIETDKSVKLRIRTRWLQLGEYDQTFILVTLEDGNQTSQNVAIADAKKYGLTDREAQVWLLRRANLSYREIADRLYITINTVKKHLKNIYAKQNEILWS